MICNIFSEFFFCTDSEDYKRSCLSSLTSFRGPRKRSSLSSITVPFVDRRSVPACPVSLFISSTVEAFQLVQSHSFVDRGPDMASFVRANSLSRNCSRIFYSSDAGPRLLNIKPLTVPSKSEKAGMMKKLHRENKEMFGELLESKQAKVCREKKSTREGSRSLENVKDEVFIAIKQENQGPKADPFTLNQSTVVPLSSLQVDSASAIDKHGDRDGQKKITKRSESNWMLKSFSKRTKIFNRVTVTPPLPPEQQENPKVIDPKVIDPSSLTQFYTPSPLNTSPDSSTLSKSEMSPKELQEIPTLKQFLASIHQCQDINHYGEVKQIRKDGSIRLRDDLHKEGAESVNSNKEAESPHLQSVINYNENEAEKDEQKTSPSPPIGQMRKAQGVITPKIKINKGRERKKSSSSHDYSKSDQNHPNQNHRLPKEDDMISAGYKLFPFDNPARQIRNDRNLTTTRIISLPYPQGPQENYKFPSVTRILTATMSPQQIKILKLWENKMINEMGEDGFKEYKEGLFRNGKLLHSNLQSLLSGEKLVADLEISEPIEGHWKSLQRILDKIKMTSVLESFVSHPELRYSGIVDAVATYGDKLVLIDWKTSEKPKPFISNTYDTPLQIAAYIGAINYDPNYEFKVVDGLAVIAYKDGQDCQIFQLKSLDILKYWKLWLQRLKLYQARLDKNE